MQDVRGGEEQRRMGDSLTTEEDPGPEKMPRQGLGREIPPGVGGDDREAGENLHIGRMHGTRIREGHRGSRAGRGRTGPGSAPSLGTLALPPSFNWSDLTIVFFFLV